MTKCYIKDCDYKPYKENGKNKHIKPGVVYKNKDGKPSCWCHEKGYYNTETVK